MYAKLNQDPFIIFIKIALLESYSSAIYHQKLIDKWSDPTNIAQRASVVIRDIHKNYERQLFLILKNIQNNCKHPKKMHTIHNKINYCMVCQSELKKSKSQYK